MIPGKETLEELYNQQKMCLEAIAHRFHVGHNKVSRWFAEYQIPVVQHKNRSEKWNARKEEIEFLYHHCRFSQAQIANYYGTSPTQIGKIMKRLAIPRRNTGRPG